VKRASPVSNQSRDQSRDQEGHDECDEAQHQWQLAGRDNVAMPPSTHAATLSDAQPRPRVLLQPDKSAGNVSAGRHRRG
jgi:hypothetical protein